MPERCQPTRETGSSSESILDLVSYPPPHTHPFSQRMGPNVCPNRRASGEQRRLRVLPSGAMTRVDRTLGCSEGLHCPVRRWHEPVREVSLRAGPPHTLPRSKVWAGHAGAQRKPLLRLVDLACPDFVSKVAPGTCLPSSRWVMRAWLFFSA